MQSNAGRPRQNTRIVSLNLMTELVEWTKANLETEDLHPLINVAIFIVLLLEIHPFQDGNGRLSRILTTLLLQAGYAYVPYSSLESVIEQSKDTYYLGLRQAQGTNRTNAPNWQPWLIFFLRSLQQQKAQLAKKIERERLILGNLPELSVQILELCRERGRVTGIYSYRVNCSLLLCYQPGDCYRARCPV